jgi:cell division protein FtsW (lipid II flippase)
MATASPLARARRSTELSLVVMAGLITAGAYTVASLGQYTQIPARIIPFLVTLLGMLLLAHLGVRWFARGADPTLLPVVALLHGIGYVMITRLEPERLAGLQTTWSIIAIVVFVASLAVVQRAPDLARYRWTFLAIGIILLLLPLVPGVGVQKGGARIWVSLGPVNLQPGEFAKIALAIFFASYLADNRQLIAGGTWKVGPLRLPEPRYLLPVVGAWAFAVLVMVAEKDLGSSLLFFTLFVVMLWVSTERAIYLVIGVVLFSTAAFVSWRLFAHVQLRVDIWLDPWADPNDDGYQLVQALYGVSDGGLMGTGLGRGSPDIVPVAESDFIFTSIGEELGLFGSAAVLMSYLLLVGAGLRIALRTENAFEKLLAVGLTTIMGMQAFIIVGGVIKLVPLTGITLPFVSYGGSSLVSNYILLALLIRLSDSTARRLHEVPDDPTMAERWAARRVRRQRPSRRSPVTQSARAAAQRRPGSAVTR